MTHHLILVREIDQQMSGSGCCGRIEGDAALWDQGGCVFGERRAMMERIGEIYRAVREAFGRSIEITVVDPRNLVSFIPLVVRDAFRYHVPVLTALQSMGSTTLSTAVFDGQVLYAGRIPSPSEVVELMRDRLQIDRVGDEQPTEIVTS